MAGGGRKEREMARRRQDVLEVAEAVFAEKGFHEASVQEIAARAEFAVGSLYNMFENKTDLYYHVIQMRMEQYMTQVRSGIEKLDDPREKIHAIVNAKVQFFDENQQFLQIFTHAMTGEQLEPPCALAGECGEIYRGYLEMVGKIFAEGIEKKTFVDIDPFSMVLALEGMTNALMAHSIQYGREALGQTTFEHCERILFDGILVEGSR